MPKGKKSEKRVEDLIDDLIRTAALKAIIFSQQNLHQAFGIDAIQEQILPDKEIAGIREQILSVAGLAVQADIHN